MTNEVRQWHIVVEASAGETHQLTEELLIGTFHGLSRSVEKIVEAWEVKMGLSVEKITLEITGRWRHEPVHGS